MPVTTSMSTPVRSASVAPLSHPETGAGEPMRVARVVDGRAGSDGAGVKLTRVLEPGLAVLFDEFRSDSAADDIGCFPPHPHRGLENVTYMMAGRMRHGDNKGNAQGRRRQENRPGGLLRFADQAGCTTPAPGCLSNCAHSSSSRGSPKR